MKMNEDEEKNRKSSTRVQAAKRATWGSELHTAWESSVQQQGKTQLQRVWEKQSCREWENERKVAKKELLWVCVRAKKNYEIFL